jgi:hypothetical protein
MFKRAFATKDYFELSIQNLAYKENVQKRVLNLYYAAHALYLTITFFWISLFI